MFGDRWEEWEVVKPVAPLVEALSRSDRRIRYQRVFDRTLFAFVFVFVFKFVFAFVFAFVFVFIYFVNLFMHSVRLSHQISKGL